MPCKCFDCPKREIVGIAAKKGHLRCLKKICESGGPYNESVFSAAVESRQSQCVAYLASGNYKISTKAQEISHSILYYLRWLGRITMFNIDTKVQLENFHPQMEWRYQLISGKLAARLRQQGRTRQLPGIRPDHVCPWMEWRYQLTSGKLAASLRQRGRIRRLPGILDCKN